MSLPGWAAGLVEGEVFLQPARLRDLTDLSSIDFSSMRSSKKATLSNFLLCCVTAVMLSGCYDSGAVKAAKNETYPRHDGTTFGKVIDNYQWCQNKEWSQKEMKTGEKYAEFKCVATTPKNFKELMHAYVSKLDAETRRYMAELKVRADKDIAEEAGRVQRHQQYYVDKLASLEAEVAAEAKAGRAHPSHAEWLAEAKLALEASRSPEKLGELEGEVNRATERLARELNKELADREESIQRRASAVLDGSITIVIQLGLDNSGEIRSHASEVIFDFGEWTYAAAKNHILRATIFEILYQDRPIMDALRGMGSLQSLQDTSDGSLLHFASTSGRYEMESK